MHGVCVAPCQEGWKDRCAEVTVLCAYGHMSLVCVWPQNPVCRSTCMSRQCWRSERSCTGWPELLVRHTHQCLEDINTSIFKWVQAAKKGDKPSHITRFCKKQYFITPPQWVQTYTAGAGLVQPKACVTFTHGAQVRADTAPICTAAFIWILLWAVTFYTANKGEKEVQRGELVGGTKTERDGVDEDGMWFYLGCSWRKLEGNPALRQTQCPDASHTVEWTSLNTRKKYRLSLEERKGLLVRAEKPVRLSVCSPEFLVGQVLHSGPQPRP